MLLTSYSAGEERNSANRSRCPSESTRLLRTMRIVTSKTLTGKPIAALLLAFAAATWMHEKVSGMAVEKGAYNVGQQAVLKCDPKMLGRIGLLGLHGPNRHLRSNLTISSRLLKAAAPADCGELECLAREVCDPQTTICETDCGLYPHELFCDCFYHCDGCANPVTNPCPDGTMYHIDARCCATASLVECEDRVPYWEYELTTTEGGVGTTAGEETTTSTSGAITTTAEITTTPAITTTTAVAADTTTEEQKTTTEKQTTTIEKATTTTERDTTTTERDTTTTDMQTTTKEKQTTTAGQTTTEQIVTTTDAATTTENTLTTLHQIDFKCPHDGYFAYPTSCRCFIECVSGIAITVVCPTNMEYDPSAERCRAPWGCVPQIGSFMGILTSLDPCPVV